MVLVQKMTKINADRQIEDRDREQIEKGMIEKEHTRRGTVK
jgi:hypothetical protein